ncbi:hypothetical protein RD792_017554 [Penstemon davidsonii]|uniref:PGG domain-containing protein n=1 Tax=Penstemon davidsonii TaxID=160366 RepID=A0ABR0CMM0_9LAMI|nr:hypothetical protein RD792_017554 [Penstemon davidsonii]
MGRIDVSILKEWFSPTEGVRSSYYDQATKVEGESNVDQAVVEMKDDQATEAEGESNVDQAVVEMKDDQATEAEGESNDDQVANKYQDIINLYMVAKYGSVDAFDRILKRISTAARVSYDDILNRVSPAGNTLLHVAAKHGNENIVTYMTTRSHELIFKKNINGDTALHLAAKAGHLTIVQHLVVIIPRANSIDLLREKNRRKNTALHEALDNGRELVAQYLIQEDHEIAYYENEEGESAFYLAARAGFVNCVTEIIEFSKDQQGIHEQFKKKSPIRAAIKNKNIDVLKVILNKIPISIQLKDEKGRTPIHYAVSLGDLEKVLYLIDKDASIAAQRDNNGLFPIHVAAIGGHVDIINLLLQYLPDPSELLDTYGCNILHHAAKSGRYNVVQYILNNPGFMELINMKDEQGNVPLHLATFNWHPKIVSALTWDNRVDVKLVNHEGMTALDIAESNMLQNPPFRQRLTWSALKSAGTPRFLFRKTHDRMIPTNSYMVDFFKERVNTLLLVSTLVATITFAAGFTMPGGYNSSDTDLGMATMLRNGKFHIFVLCDTMAMYCSSVVVVALIFAQLGDLRLMHTSLSLALPLLGIALTMMSMAFTAGVYLVVSSLRWLSNVVLLLGFTFLVILLILLVPLCMPFSSSNRIVRYLSYYPYYLLLLATSR